MDWWNVSVFGVIPVLAVVCLFSLRQKHLWSAPIISTILAVVISLVAMPAILEEGDSSTMFFALVLPIHFIITLILTAVASGISFVLKRKRQAEQS